jgi:hypothetical protein
MSNIPKAREILARACNTLSMNKGVRAHILEALSYMHRRQPPDGYVRDGSAKGLTPKQRLKAIALRKTGLSKKKIALKFGTDTGRISEATNPKDPV